MAMEPARPPQTQRFGELLRQHRIAASLSQEALAERANVSARAISDLERGAKNRPHLETVRLLANALDLNQVERSMLAAAARSGTGQLTNSATAESAEPLAVDLPTFLTTLIGRETELSWIVRIFREGNTRLMTLTGPGGVGKTRIAVAVATELRGDFSDGVVFVDLSLLSAPSLLLPRLAQACNIVEDQRRPLTDELNAFLKHKELLLVLDNFEQILDAAETIKGLLVGAPNLNVLVTSRAPLHVSGEQEFLVTPLALPGEVDNAENESTLSASVQLFVDRAALHLPSVSLTPANVQIVGEICRRLDGLPLAIELAAARVKVMPLAALLSRLNDGFGVLTGGARDLPERQQTLHSTIAWSYELLSVTDQTLFRRLAAFEGGWSLKAAEEITILSDDESAFDVLNGLASLVENSLIHIMDQGDEPRFRMLETIREFASKVLRESGDESSVRANHANFFVGLADRHLGALELPDWRWHSRIGTDAERYTDIIGFDVANMIASFGWLAQCGVTEQLWRISRALANYWWVTGQISQGRYRLEPIVQLYTGNATSDAYAAVVLACAAFALAQEELTTAAHWARQALELYRNRGEIEGTTRAQWILARAEEYLGHHDIARSIANDLVLGLRRSGDPRAVADAAMMLGSIAMHEGDDLQASRWFAEGLELYRREANLPLMADSLHLLALTQSDAAVAEELFKEALAISKELNDDQLMVTLRTRLANLALLKGDYELAVAQGQELLGLWNSFEQSRDAILGRSHCHLAIGRGRLYTGDFVGALCSLEVALAGYKDIEALHYHCSTLIYAGDAAAALGNRSLAEIYYLDGIAEAREISTPYSLATSLISFGIFMASGREYLAAIPLVTEGAQHLRAVPTPYLSPWYLEEIARLALYTLPSDAVHLFGAAAALRNSDPTAKRPVWDREKEDVIGKARGILSADCFDKCWALGSSFTQHQALDKAVSVLKALCR